ncbi:MAG: D-alanyl-D-alanine carboxypeptidase, partial [Proteobacteria bacterium]|nr:D-alanyl-D-alanine carboxypeptidase [Pseudomonadota bacterium]
PGTLDKGVLAAKNYAEKILNLKDLSIVEGSGISRKNRISAKSLHKTIEAFIPYHNLMQKKEREFYKTGTLKDINTRVGYIRGNKEELYSFVVMINTPGKSAEPIMNRLLKVLK